MTGRVTGRAAPCFVLAGWLVSVWFITLTPGVWCWGGNVLEGWHTVSVRDIVNAQPAILPWVSPVWVYCCFPTSLAVYGRFPCCLLSVACEVWKHFVAFMNFVLLLFVLCCSVCMLRLACPMLLCLYAMSCLSYVAMSCLFYAAIVYIVIVFNNLPRDCGWKLAGWLKPALLLKRWLMCTVPVKIKK